jgi:DNA repair exonuclease SbcCD ATPase subunit
MVALWLATALIAVLISSGSPPTHGLTMTPNTASPQADSGTPAASTAEQSARFEPRCFTSPDVSHVDSVSEKFVILRQARQRISQFLQQDFGDRDYYKQQLETRGGYSARLSAPIALRAATDIGEDLDETRDKASASVKRITEELDTAQRSPGSIAATIDNLKSQKTKAEADLAEIERRIKNRDTEKKRDEELQKQIEEYRKAREAEIARLETQLRAVNSDVDCLSRAQAQVDETINTLLIPETQKKYL